jgi:phage/plasmid primase-like uncharacterized protein
MEEKEKIHLRARGHWEWIFNALAPNALGAAMKAGQKSEPDHVACPVHNPSKDGFRLFGDWKISGGGVCNTCGTFSNGFSVLKWLYGWDYPTAAAEVERLFDGETASEARERQVCAKPQQETEIERTERLRAKLREVYGETVPLDDPLAQVARMYLVSRGLDLRVALGVSAMRFHPALEYYESAHGRAEKIGEFPAIVSAVTDNRGRALGMHRIYLDHTGAKLPVSAPKKLMASPWGYTGASVRLQNTFDGIPSRLNVCEGLETALAVRSVTREPVWATLNTGLMKGFLPPEGVEEIWIWADKDRPAEQAGKTVRPGQAAAKTLKAALWERGIPARILLPVLEIPVQQTSVDWNDVLGVQGPLAFPNARVANRWSRIAREAVTVRETDARHG